VKLGLSLKARTLAELLKNRVLREIFWAKRVEITRERGMIYDEKLYDLHCSSTQRHYEPCSSLSSSQRNAFSCYFYTLPCLKHLSKLSHLELRAKHKTPFVLPYKQMAELPRALCSAVIALCRTPDKFKMKLLWPEMGVPSSAGNSDLSTYVLNV
jgi:hypothetical protein